MTQTTNSRQADIEALRPLAKKTGVSLNTLYRRLGRKQSDSPADGLFILIALSAKEPSARRLG